MKHQNKEYLQSLVITGGTILGAFLVRKGLEQLYEKKTGEEAPKNPYPENNSLKEALLWTVATGVVASVTKVLLRYTFTAGSEKVIEN
ncbi:DUF4235 domain-containing protein [Cyclobacterium marinum]|uniref:DUF4235 domain-containing protein n=1 Tax=Cyclobacterium marinum TaxID=104 RepID=UPI0011ED1D98|nr:DUF4235 domain-containing protein [Cyclobacterium marinum]MBI0398890.1 DUF4235 domain-containing protein [Cyclobacterium marinum]